ncbi:MAG: acyl-ACP--UDP-N-acetylglucosamine O-acyltransferase [Planctomycetes bacterium]|nr:acyl-ACP--UDP-N-acetylglucosamine O-acyltransferase [Planctomycetota bacterium]
MSQIHSTAVISNDATIGSGVRIGPFCVIEGGAEVGDGCRIAAYVAIREGTSLGAGNVIHEHAVLGGDPQYVNAKGPFGKVVIGAGNVIREAATVHRGLKADHVTRIGDGNYLMAGAHLGHDCVVGDHNIIANNTLLAGHVTVHSHAYISAAVAVHQFCRIGSYAMVGGQSHVNKDVPPFVTLDGLTSRVVGLNQIGLKRKGFRPEEIAQLKAAYRVIYRRGLTWSEVLAELAAEFSSGPAAAFRAFFEGGQRGFMPERRTPRAASVKLPHEPTSDDQAESLRKVG